METGNLSDYHYKVVELKRENERLRNLLERAVNMHTMSGFVPHKDSLNPVHSWLYEAMAQLEMTEDKT
jgi:hypothetical protein